MSHGVGQYNERIATLKKDGLTLEQIAEQFGVTRQRIHQILKQYHPYAQSKYTTEKSASRIVGVNLWYLRKRGLITCHYVSPGRYRYSKADIERALHIAYHLCHRCGVKTHYRRRFCPSCSKEARRNPYPYRSPEGKRKCSEASRNWIVNHPERAREIQRKAWAKYQRKKSVVECANAVYIIRCDGHFPKGMVFRAVAREIGCLVLITGDRVCNTQVKRIQ